MSNTKNIIMRIVAAFAASALGVVGAGALAGVSLPKAAFMAGVGAVAKIVEGISKAYLNDGKLDAAEIDEIFNGPSKTAKE